ncbi:hypothetical protein HYH02_012323 [Chlamydomonas schloesseri]|uniref:RING-type domain-containing protein n=1 Tax=Chlamydomonas schloesseri TaxID=2026947 RepID=A0A835SWA6_9CHLO|nr:hypothetical protein HYH02_012323 [Chlamydomonas schloesseri]|eukprot:KAG2434497.1 hypothetical protein HYH02_012323 [Chlamydomonas schloesseri]
MEVLGGGQPAQARDLDARSEAAIKYLLERPTVEQRRAAASLPWPQLLAAVRALSGCQRCGFVPTVIAAFCPELAAALSAPLSSSSSSSGHDSSNGAVSYGLGPGALDAESSAELLFPARSGGSATSGGLLAPAQLLALLDNSGGGTDLVSLLQFAWRDAAGSGAAAAAASAAAGDVAAAPDQDVGAFSGRVGPGSANGGGLGGGGGGPRRLALNDALLGKSRLLRRFLTESLGIMEALAEDVGDCRRHVGYPGPAELASTLSRLELQRAHTLERLAAWGVLRTPAAAAAAAPPAAGSATAIGGQGLRRQSQPGQGRGREAASTAAAAAMAPTEEEETDLELAVAIQLSLQEAAAAAATVLSSAPTGDAGGGEGQAQQTPGRGTPAQERAPWTPPAQPPAAAPRSLPGSAAVTPSGPGAEAEDVGAEAGGRSPAPAGGWSARGARSRPVGESVEGLAACGLAVDQPGQGHGHTRSPAPEPRGLPPAAPAIAPAGASMASPVHGAESMAATAPVEAPVAAGAPLSVSAAAAAAAGLEDASVLVDAGAVAALPPSLRERVEQLVSQLMQVQQRRMRLHHACQHSIVAAGRKLLLLLLQQLWAGLLRAADSAAVSATASSALAFTAQAAEEVVVSAEDPVGGRGTAVAATAAPLRAASASARTGPRPPLPGRPAAGLTGASSAPSPLPSASPGGPTAALSGSPGGAAAARRQPRYAGRLADLAEGLGDEDTHLDLDALDPDSEANRNLDPGRGLPGLPEVSDLESVLEDVQRLREREGRAGGGGGGGGSVQGGGSIDVYGHDDRRLQTWHGRSGRAGFAATGSDGEEEAVGEGWDDALRTSTSSRLLLSSSIGAFRADSSSSSSSSLRGARDALSGRLRQSSAPVATSATAAGAGTGLSATLPAIDSSAAARRSIALPSAAAAAAMRAAAASGPDGGAAGARPPLGSAARRSMAALWESTAAGLGPGGGSSSASAVSSSSRAAATGADLGDAGSAAGGDRASAADREARISRILDRSSIAISSGRVLGLSSVGGGGVGGACGPACVAARADQAEQLRVLQGQLCRCQASQSELQREVGRLLDQMADSRRVAEQTTAAVRRELAQWQGDAQALQGLGPEALSDLAGRMEAALSRVRAAALAAAAERDHQCPVCWEARKGLVFGCGHQTCVGCGEKLAACPICREPVALRIRVYG